MVHPLLLQNLLYLHRRISENKKVIMKIESHKEPRNVEAFHKMNIQQNEGLEEKK